MNKEHILKEIERTARENNDNPLGREKFAKETGIKTGDWQGKYWTKWSDALKEAGYEPNRMQAAYEENWLLEQIVLLIKAINKFPTVSEFDFKAYNTKNFPSYNTIRQRLGTQTELANKLLDYCKGIPEYSNVLRILADYVKNNSYTITEEVTYSSKGNDQEFGYVYLMKSGRFYKIGNSNNVERRNYDLGLILPEKIDIIHKIQTDDPVGIEAYWHDRFKEKRKQGEWFDLAKEEISAFKRRKFM